MDKLKDNFVEISIGDITLDGNLAIPSRSKGIIVFAHGSGSSRFSPRNRLVAKTLQAKGIATLLIDLLTREEERIDVRTRQFRFDIDLLSERLIAVTQWLRINDRTKNHNIGYFGSSTGAAAVLIAAGRYPEQVKAIVSRGGRTDLAGNYVLKVEAPTLLIVGGNDIPVINLNRKTLNRLRSKKKLEIVLGASHLFEEPGKLEEVAELAGNWFKKYLE